MQLHMEKQLSSKKDMLTKHDNRVCTECQEKFQSSLKLLKHVTNHQHKDEEEVEIKDSDEVNKNKPTESIEAVNNAEKNGVSSVSSSFFDKFL